MEEINIILIGESSPWYYNYGFALWNLSWKLPYCLFIDCIQAGGFQGSGSFMYWFNHEEDDSENEEGTSIEIERQPWEARTWLLKLQLSLTFRGRLVQSCLIPGTMFQMHFSSIVKRKKKRKLWTWEPWPWSSLVKPSGPPWVTTCSCSAHYQTSYLCSWPWHPPAAGGSHFPPWITGHVQGFLDDFFFESGQIIYHLGCQGRKNDCLWKEGII